MEKSNRCSVKRFSGILRFSLLLALLFVLKMPTTSQAQVRAGMGYLKMLPGVRGIGVAKTMTGALDFTDSFYANPAATGFLREWQWSATYTNWISEVYNASFLYGKQVRTPWSRHSRFVVGANYLGIPEFTSSSEPAVSGNHLLATFGYGQQLGWISENLSAGVNLKYFNAKLADYDASSIIYDLGLLFRTRRLDFISPGNEFLDYAIFSAGFSVTNLGESIQFDQVGTPLPRTLRAGIALNFGAHRGLQMSLATDYQEIRDEDGFISIGSEISWQQIFSVRMGYSFEENLLGKYNFGASLRIDDRILNSIIPGRNNALRFDLASNQNNEFFSTPYHGSITHQPTGPEYFEFLYPLSGTRVDGDSLRLTWETTRDPDLYDDTNFWVVVASDRQKLSGIQKLAEHSTEELIYYLNTTPGFVLNTKQEQSSAWVTDLAGGHYYWTVLAYDKDRHVRFAESNGEQIQDFYVTQPRLNIIAINFLPDEWITEDDYQGVVEVTVQNEGDRTAQNFVLALNDSASVYVASRNPVAATDSYFGGEKLMPEIEPGSSAKINFEWRTGRHGLHQIQAGISKQNHPGSIVAQRTAGFYTIPKGKYTAPASAVAMNLFETTFELPYMGRIFFNQNSARIGAQYLHNSTIKAPLAQFAEKLVQHPEVEISLRASIDRNSDESDLLLAEARAKAVRDALHNLGVPMSQILILPDTVIQKRRMPRKAEDAEWIRQENRRVDITTDKASEEIVFGPVESLYEQKTSLPINFTANIKSTVPLEIGKMFLEGTTWRDSLTVIETAPTRQLEGKITWEHSFAATSGRWADHDVSYNLVVKDSLQRQFQVKPKTVWLEAEVTGRERMYYVLAQFKYARSFYDFYWSNLLDKVPFVLQDQNMRMQFIGHGCALGPDAVNLRLSKKRASQFTGIFLDDLKKRDVSLYSKIKSRIDPPRGMGESEELSFTTPGGGQQVIGDNNTPLGRNLNRRVMVRIYEKNKK